MKNKSNLAAKIICGSFALGVLGDAVLRESPLGLNAPLWSAAVILLILLLERWQSIRIKGDPVWLAVAFLYAAAFAWRDSSVLKCLDALALFTSVSFLFLPESAVARLATCFECGASVVSCAINAAFGALPLMLTDLDLSNTPRQQWLRPAMAVGRGLLIAAPLMLLFGALFASADAVFDGIVKSIFSFNVPDLIIHSLIIALIAFIAAGFIRGLLLGRLVDFKHRDRAASMSIGTQQFEFDDASRAPANLIGIVEVTTALGLLDMLFLVFVVVQLRYLFGGRRLVEATSGLSYSVYAREGFFELVAVTALVLPLLLVADWLLRRDTNINLRVFRMLGAALLMMLFVVIASALDRMRTYQGEYGQTELRLYTTAFMFWLAAVSIWLGVTVLRGKRERFAFGAVVSGLAMVLILNALNPDALIVRTNTAFARQGRHFDAVYLTSLSADAVPALIEAFPSLNETDRRTASRWVLGNWFPPQREGWRSWSLARHDAWRATGKARDQLSRSAVGPE
ncbi:MAG TPA: DUF4173 domain-containing protein [Blastocatellia bacterium]|nr:DUF4173 domain-containing protein [Blastocatellia bacterium]